MSGIVSTVGKWASPYALTVDVDTGVIIIADPVHGIVVKMTLGGKYSLPLV